MLKCTLMPAEYTEENKAYTSSDCVVNASHTYFFVQKVVHSGIPV